MIDNPDAESIYQLLIGFGLNILSKEDSLLMSIYPANYHKTDISRFPIVTGSYDCGKWFRPIHLSIFNQEEKDFEIKRGDPLFYIKFHTDDKIQLERFNMNEEILSHVASTVEVKKYFVVNSKKWMDDLMIGYDCLTNVVMKTNELSVKWLKWLGAEFSDCQFDGYMSFILERK